LKHTLRFLSHWAGATRIDVLHSPFVFRLYNTCIKPTPSGKVDMLFQRVAAYMQTPISLHPSSYMPNHAILIRINQHIQPDEWNNMLQNIGKKGTIVIEKPHHNKRINMMQYMWQCNHIHVCIDLFDACIITSRQEQVKEYFKLRW
jgi:hypothetical protein